MSAYRPPPIFPYNAFGLVSFYNFMFEDRGIKLEPHLVPPCHALMDKRIKKLLIVLGPGAGKSLLISVAYPSFEIGYDPSTTFLEVSAGENLVQGFQSAIMDWIETSPRWKTAFPDVTPDKGSGWSNERGMFVTGHKSGDPDATLFACGLDSSALVGKHARNINFDDLHNEETSATEDQCLKVRTKYYRTLMGRADPRGARFVGAGRRWHQEDIYGHLKQSGDYVTMELQAIRDKETDLWWDVTVPDGLECCFTDGSVPESELVKQS